MEPKPVINKVRKMLFMMNNERKGEMAEGGSVYWNGLGKGSVIILSLSLSPLNCWK